MVAEAGKGQSTHPALKYRFGLICLIDWIGVFQILLYGNGNWFFMHSFQ
ncbi:MAG: hypothetical protein ACJZ86_01900 [Pontiellaceae bacterium]